MNTQKQKNAGKHTAVHHQNGSNTDTAQSHFKKAGADPYNTHPERSDHKPEKDVHTKELHEKELKAKESEDDDSESNK